MRILFFTSLKGFHGKKWLLALAQQHEVHVATFRVDPEDKITGVIFHEILPKVDQQLTQAASPPSHTPKQEARLTFKIGYKHAKDFAKVINMVKPDIVHAHQSVPFGWYALRALKKAKAKPKFIVSVWGTDVIGYPESAWLYRWLNQQVLGKADVITATGGILREKASQFAAGKTIQIIPFGIDLNKFYPKIKPADNVSLFGIAKQLKPVYRIDYALRALAIAKENNPNFKLEIAGSGPELDKLKALAKKLEIYDSVKFLGHTEPKHIPDLMRRWDCLLNPTKQEGFGVVALEAAAVGTPMIATNTGGLPEVTIQNKTAILLDDMTPKTLAAEMSKMAQDKTLTNKALTAGPMFVKHNFAWNKNVTQMNSLYTEATQ